MPDKLTDSEIVKALECCMNGHCDDDCPFRETREHCHNLDSLILDLINRLQAENERLEKENKHYAELEQGCYVTGVKNIKAEAYKEAFEKVKPIIREIVDRMFDDNESNCVIHDCVKPSKIACNSEICIQENKQAWEDRIDNLLKELVGEDK